MQQIWNSSYFFFTFKLHFSLTDCSIDFLFNSCKKLAYF